MKLLTALQMTELEQLAIKEYAIDSLLLMENAARGFCDALEAELGSLAGRSVAVVCGKGNNGGDGFAISRHLYNRGADVTVIAGFEPDTLKPDARKNFEIITRMGIPVLPPPALGSRRFDLCVDALFGTGFHGEPDEAAAALITALNAQGGTVIAVDIPSGADATTGKTGGSCVRADFTITFAFAKPGHFLYPAKARCGKVIVTDISIPRHLGAGFPATCFTLDEALAGRLPRRDENSHKGSFGKVLVFAGSVGMSGACVMAATAALKAGAGMVTAAVPRPLTDILGAHFVEIMTLPLPVEGDALSKTAAGMVEERLRHQDVLLAGCGLGTADGTKKALLSVVTACDKPMVIDADGINALKGHIHVIKNKSVPAVLTPHPLEFSRISGHSMEYIQENRLQAAEAFAREFGVVLVLKGADTLVAHPDGRIYICPQSNSGLAKAGSGDVLSGVIAALLAQGAPPGDAANLGVYLHSRAGMLARKRLGPYGMTATDVLAALPGAVAALAETEQR